MGRVDRFPSGHLKKFEPLDTRDFIPFDEYEELTLDNIKEACENFYKAPEDSCDILASDRGISCTKLEQLKGKKVFFIRFIPPCDVGTKDKMPPLPPARPCTSVPINLSNTPPKSAVPPKSLSISQLLKAGELVKPAKQNLATLELERFDI